MFQSSIMFKASIICIFLLSIVLQGCNGFHLRGLEPVAAGERNSGPIVIQLDSTLPNEWRFEFLRFCEQRGIKVQDKARWKLQLSNAKEERNVASLNSRVKAAEYELISSLDIKLVDAANERILMQTTLDTHRIYRFDEVRVIAKYREEQLIQQQMRQNIFQSVLRLTQHQIKNVGTEVPKED